MLRIGIFSAIPTVLSLPRTDFLTLTMHRDLLALINEGLKIVITKDGVALVASMSDQLLQGAVR